MSAERRWRAPEWTITPLRLKKCRACGQLKETATEFHFDKLSRDGVSGYCRACKSIRMAAYHAAKKGRAA